MTQKFKFYILLFIGFFFIGSLEVFGQDRPSTDQADSIDVLKADTIHAKFISVDTIKVEALLKNDQLESKIIKDRTLYINFGNRRIKSIPKKLDDGDIYYVVIDNINMNLYKVSLANKDSIITSKVEFPTLDLPGLETLTSFLKEFSSSFSEPDDESVEFGKKPKKTLQFPIKIIPDSLGKIKAYLIEKGRQVERINYDIDSLKLSVQTLRLSYLVKNDTTWRVKLADSLDMRSVFERSNSLRSELKKIIRNVEKNKKAYDQFESDIKGFEKLKKEINTLFSTVLEAGAKVYTTMNAENVSAWLQSIVHLENNSETTYRFLPLQFRGDFGKVNLSIVPKDEDSGLSSYETEIWFPHPQKRYIGAGISFYYGFGFKNASYSILENRSDSDTTYTIVDENISKGEAGIAALVHGGWKICKSDLISIEFTLGPAISLTDNPKPRLAIGGGFAFGKRQKFTINGLFMLGNVDRLSKKYSLTESYEVRPEDVTVSDITTSFALSVGYVYKF